MKRNKYYAEKTTVDGITFHSKKEAGRYTELKMLKRSGHINDLELQPRFKICDSVMFEGKKQRARYYVADFSYTEKDIIIVEDCKGYRTDLYKLKRNIFLSLYPQYKFTET